MIETTPAIQTTPTPLPTWVQGLIGVLIAITGVLAGPHVLPNLQPTPKPPIITPNVTPVPKPNNTPTPTPMPAKAIVATVNGTVVHGLVEAGQLVVVKGEGGLKVAATSYPPSSASIHKFSVEELACVLKPGATLQVVGYENDSDPITMSIAANQAPQPPPVNPQPNPQPQPTPPTPVDPSPTPVRTGKVLISIVEDPNNRPPELAMLLSNFTTWNKYKEAGNEWILFPQNSKENQGVLAINALATNNVLVPGIVIQDLSTKVVLYAGPLKGKTIKDVTALVNQYTGGNL